MVINYIWVASARQVASIFKASMLPGAMAQLSSRYRTDEIGKPVTWFFAMSNRAGFVGPLLCYARGGTTVRKACSHDKQFLVGGMAA
ncbi:hypothetical protein CTA2_12721 [Colletotrichum tanaceti]|uniref:Uncharacterized protein n=1 Tax=Colletotrichum tanaceti TaxID=1306861 RepID=A0A4U6XGH1_9PEZI|nr:hypothetical protein CTA2_12721 [Colletotrichum tanaceti]TKW54801.1 hypothetical protein CTA1_5904 [Colletotrichum tanaceti]